MSARLTESAYRTALARISELIPLDPDPASFEGCELESLSVLAEEYEKERFPFEAPTPEALAEFRRVEAGK